MSEQEDWRREWTAPLAPTRWEKKYPEQDCLISVRLVPVDNKGRPFFWSVDSLYAGHVAAGSAPTLAMAEYHAEKAWALHRRCQAECELHLSEKK